MLEETYATRGLAEAASAVGEGVLALAAAGRCMNKPVVSFFA